MEIFKSFTFDSAHYLPNVPEGHKCKNMHGHTYHLSVYIKGTPHPHYGWVMDFGDLKAIISPIIEQLDHHILNEIEGLENPTCELLGQWIWNRLSTKCPQLSRIELNETPTSGVVITA